MAYLTIQTPRAGLRIHRLEGDRCLLGRAETSDIEVDDDAISREHLELVREGDSWSARDVGSRNGTELNREPLTEMRALRPGDELHVGDTLVHFHVGDPARRGARERETAELGVRRDRAVVGESPAFRKVLDLVERVAPRDVEVLLTGESGTGKEVLARLLHERSARSGGPFRTINCPALAASLFEAELFGVESGTATGVEGRVGHVELAEGGTLFLDEVADLEAGVQAKLLRLIQEKTYERVGGRETRHADVRFVAATNKDLEQEVERGAFRQDLYFRLAVFPIEIPPLRERPEDVVPLARHFLREVAPGVRLADEAGLHLERLPWPGNARELANALKRAAILATRGVIEVDHLPAELGASGTAGDVEMTVRNEAELARRLLEDIRAGRTTFEEGVKQPFLRRELSKDCVRSFVALAVERGSGGYKGMAQLLGIEAEHKKLLDWLRHHGLQPDRSDRGRER